MEPRLPVSPTPHPLSRTERMVQLLEFEFFTLSSCHMGHLTKAIIMPILKVGRLRKVK